MEGGVIGSSPELDPPAVGRMARLDQGKIEELIENMKDLPVKELIENMKDPKKRKEFLELVKEMQQMWDYKKRLLDQYHAHGYVEVLVDDENMWGM